MDIKLAGSASFQSCYAAGGLNKKPYFDRSCPRSQNQSCTEGSGGLEVIAVDEANYYGGLLTAGTQNSSPGSLPETQWLEAPGRWEEEVPVVPV